MSKTAKIKSDLDDVSAMVEIFQVLKQVASNQFYSTARKKEKFVEFAEAFTGFFRMVNLSHAKSPLVHNDVDAKLYIMITGEGGFMAEMTAKVVKEALRRIESPEKDRFIVLGRKGCEKMSMTEYEFTGIKGVDEKGLYPTTLEVKEKATEMVMQGEVGTAYAIYPRAVSLEAIKPFAVKLLPSDELLSHQEGITGDLPGHVFVESDLDDIIGTLADIWLTCRLYEMLLDCQVAGYAAQSQQLEEGLDKLKGDQKSLASAFRKSQKGDIDSSMREVFTAKTIISR